MPTFKLDTDTYVEVSFFDTLYLKDHKWAESTALWPHRCIITAEIIWPFTKAVRGVRYLRNQGFRSGFGPNIVEKHWAKSKPWTIKALEGRFS